uniref:efflux RND transporter periplasmic adaptor subunit n=1 Tax=uncultured Sphingomonas sp. TaxID=158754 RepID=UPI0025ED4AEE|nr:efflux RND transporter periplasmic adaptor subunit [uncultured Sphingomonas sp.]
MNREARLEASDTLVVVDRSARRRRNLIIGALLAVAAALLLAFYFMGRGAPDAAPASAAGGELGNSVPAVTVIVPGRELVQRTISTTGSLAARRDLPVGVPGEGGQIRRVLVEPGQWVRAGQTLAVIDRSVQSQEAAQQAASIQVARADLRIAQANVDRAQQLVNRGFVSRANLDQLIATRDAAAARVRVAQAQLNGTRARIGRLDIRAPAAGLVLARDVEAGQVVGAGSAALFRIAQGGEMELVARLPQSDLAQVRVGVPATITPIGSEQRFQGSVWQVSPIIDPQTRQGDARISIPYNRELRPGGFASADIVAGAVTAPLLPESAVQSDDRGNYVYILNNKNEVVRRDVKIGEVSDQGVTVVAGLTGNELIVESAGAFLNPGQKVRPERRKS